MDAAAPHLLGAVGRDAETFSQEHGWVLCVE